MNSPDADGAGKLTSRLSTVGQRPVAGESSWKPSRSGRPVARPERRCNGSLSGSPHPVQVGAVGGGPSRPGPGVGRRTLAQRQRAVGGGRSQAGRAGGLIRKNRTILVGLGSGPGGVGSRSNWTPSGSFSKSRTASEPWRWVREGDSPGRALRRGGRAIARSGRRRCHSDVSRLRSHRSRNGRGRRSGDSDGLR